MCVDDAAMDDMTKSQSPQQVPYAGLPSSPVYARRPTLAQFEYPQASQHPAGMVQPLRPPIQFTSSIQLRRPSSQLANEYLPQSRQHQQQQQQQQGTCTTEEPTPKTTRVRLPSRLPVVVLRHLCSIKPPPPSPVTYMAPAWALPSYVSANPYTPQPSPGQYARYRLSAIGNAYTPAPDANANTIGHGYFHSPSFAALAPPTPTPPSNCHDPQ